MSESTRHNLGANLIALLGAGVIAACMTGGPLWLPGLLLAMQAGLGLGALPVWTRLRVAMFWRVTYTPLPPAGVWMETESTRRRGPLRPEPLPPPLQAARVATCPRRGGHLMYDSSGWCVLCGTDLPVPRPLIRGEF